MECFRREVPATEYSDYRNAILQDMSSGESLLCREKTVFFATTSGMTDDPKIIPHTRRSLVGYLVATLPLFSGVLRAVGLRALKGKLLFVVGRAEDSRTSCNIRVGSISGAISTLLYKMVPSLFVYSPSHADRFSGRDRYEFILECIRQSKVSGVLGTNPLLIYRMLADAAEQPLSNGNTQRPLFDAYPLLSFVMCITGWPATQHVQNLRRCLPDNVRILDPGVGSSEGLFTRGGLGCEPVGFPVSAPFSFIEWMPVGGVGDAASSELRNLIGAEVEPLLTSCNGFLRYRMGDCYRVESRGSDLVLRFLRRTSDIYSATIEHVTPQVIESVVRRLDNHFALQIRDYICVIQALDGGQGRYWFLVEHERSSYSQPSDHAVQEELDRLLIAASPEIRNARDGDRFLLRPSVVLDARARTVIRSVRTDTYTSAPQPKEHMIFVGEDARRILTALT